MTFSSGEVLTAANLNDLNITSATLTTTATTDTELLRLEGAWSTTNRMAWISGVTTTDDGVLARIGLGTDPNGANNNDGGIVFQTTTAADTTGSTLATAMTIADGGQVGIGTTAPLRSLDVLTDVIISNGNPAYLWHLDSSNDLGLYYKNAAGDTGWTTRLTIASNGDISVKSAGIKFTGATIVGNDNSCGMRWNSPNLYGTVDNAVSMVIGTTSDRRLKTDIEVLNDGLARVLELKPCSYLPLDLPQDGEEPALAGEGDIRHPGLIADEVEATEPWAVPPLVDGAYQSVNYAGLVPLLVSAIQEQQTQIDALTARIEQLEA